jgi:transposase
MPITLPDARELSDEILQALRLRAVRGRELGFTEADVANLLGVARETVSRWWSAYSTRGLGALPRERSGRPPGSGRLLSDEQARHIQGLLDNRSPEDLGIPAPLWNRRAVRDLIGKEFTIDLAVRTVGAYLKRWGYTAKKPRRHARKQDPEAGPARTLRAFGNLYHLRPSRPVCHILLGRFHRHRRSAGHIWPTSPGLVWTRSFCVSRSWKTHVPPSIGSIPWSVLSSSP